MFTGIIETVGKVKEVIPNGSNRIFWVESPISSQFKVDQSVSHNGVCLTVEEIMGNSHRITAIDETLQKTNLSTWTEGTFINLEQCLQLNDRLDGHIVQGHADTTGTCIKRKEKKGSWEFEIEFPKKFAELVIDKGSICVNGISLTAFNVKKKSFCIAVIPYTFEHTNINKVEKGNTVNLEFDIIGKYLIRRLSLREK
ncbi:MAG: riboflavin synthase [Chitinophagaceae bacterium]|nr:riboflavin synthase [Chitinophagaceae bacterium]